ncbi:MAG: SurA N-terminal domain-containing protein [Proteiniphilum sp.]|jgi:peptidyl-prolyl cis-trans isomerase D|uniref:peptidylprolyl isomerase n=1 Tax=Proteiniphilum sp. TaxID=1926877 RepID=UPI002B205E68|nr:SurA N-terminal domain-containing protein [Proteiniphilum sp.]MEA5129106.1 SurA N-terminal domain-containing protein [Proteiniphilum sp.]
MATLQKIRDKGTLLVIIIGLALLAFVLGDLLTSGRTLFGRAQDKAFVVNREVISTQQYADKITQFEEFQKMVSGQSSLDENVSSQIREVVYQQMVRDRLLGNQAEKLGLTITKEELNDLVHGQSISPVLQQLPFFVDPQTGMFDRNALIQFINTVNIPSPNPQEQALVNQYKSLWLFIEEMVRTQRLEEKYISLLSNAIIANDVEAKAAFDYSQQNADIEYAMKSFFTVPDSTVNVTDDEIKAFYNKHKGSFRMEAPLVKLSYFTKGITPSDEDYADVEAESHKAFDELSSAANPAAIVADYSQTPYRDIFVSEHMLTPTQVEFVRDAAINEMYGPTREGDSFHIYKLIDKTVAPDSVHLSMMAIPDASIVGQDSVITHFVDSIYGVIAGGTPFAVVANSLNPNSNGGDMGWARETDLAGFSTDLVKTAFNAPVGRPVKLSIPGQQLILQVEERTRPVNKYKLAIVDMPVLPSEKTSNNIDNELNQFVSSPDVSQKFNELASEKGYMVMPGITVSANEFSLAQIPGSRQVITWAANEKKAGTVKKFDLTNLRIIARVERVIPSGTTPLSEVSSGIRSQLVNEKKAEKIISDLKSQNLSSLDAYAAAMNTHADTVRFVNFNTQNITGLGFEPALNAISAFAPLNKIVGPVKGNMGVYVAAVPNRTEGSDEYDADEQKNQILNNNAYRLQMQSIEVLKTKLGVEDNRFRFF